MGIYRSGLCRGGHLHGSVRAAIGFVFDEPALHRGIGAATRYEFAQFAISGSDRLTTRETEPLAIIGLWVAADPRRAAPTVSEVLQLLTNEVCP